MLAPSPASWADTWSDAHNEPVAAWRLDTSDGARQLARERVRVDQPGEADPVGAERITYVAPPGVAATAWRTVPAAAVIDELKIRLDGRASLPGARLVAEVVTPRSDDADSGPIRLLLRSEPTANSGELTLRLDQLPARLRREARVWRVANPTKSIDPRGAYIDRIGLSLPGSGQPARVWVRELTLETVVTPLRRAGGRLVEQQDADKVTPESVAAASRLKPTEVTLRSDGFRIDGALYYPRVWRWRGEPFAALAARGINTVWLDATPTPQQLADAAHARLRLICPPPESDEAAEQVASWDRVLAWALPGPLTARDLDAGLVTIQASRGLPAAAQRPVLAHVADGRDGWGRAADGLLVDRTTSRFADGLSRSLEADRTAPRLEVIRLDVEGAVAAQLDALIGDGVATTWAPMQDIDTGVHRALAAGAIGVAFTADERIDGADDATRAAAGWLEAVNRRLRLVEPWLVGPRTRRVSQADGAAILQRAGARLTVLPTLRSPASDPTAAPADDTTAPHYRLTPAGLAAWTPESSGRPGDRLACNDPRVVRSLRSYTAQSAVAAADNTGKLATLALRQADALTPEARLRAQSLIDTSRLARTRRDAAGAYDAACSALRLISAAQSARLALARQGAVLSSSPLAVLPQTLTEHFRMEQILAASQRGPNRLHGGSFEDIDAARRAGWRHPPSDAVAGSVALVEADAVHGDRVLRLTGESDDATATIVSPSIEIDAGDTLEVTGWVRVTDTPPGGVLLIGDSLGGQELDLVVSESLPEWTAFRLLRATASNTSLTVSFTTHGRIDAEVDGVMVRAVQPLGVARRQATQAK